MEESGYKQGKRRKVLTDVGEGTQVRIVGSQFALKQECGESCNSGLQVVDVTTDHHLVLVNPNVVKNNPLLQPATAKQLKAVSQGRIPSPGASVNDGRVHAASESYWTSQLYE